MLYRLQERVWEETLCAEGEAVLCCRSSVPEFSLLAQGPLRRMNRFYAHAENLFQRWCRKKLFPLASAQRSSERSASRPFEAWEARLDYESLAREEDDTLLLTLHVHGKGVKESSLPLRWDLNRGFLCR